MPKKKGEVVETVQVVFRVPADLHAALLAAAAGLGLDLSNLLRMVIAEHAAEYVERGRRATAALGQARAGADSRSGGVAGAGSRSHATAGGRRQAGEAPRDA
jgi:hypothetical protein